jgi:hypothetical protein
MLIPIPKQAYKICVIMKETSPGGPTRSRNNRNTTSRSRRPEREQEIIISQIVYKKRGR